VVSSYVGLRRARLPLAIRTRAGVELQLKEFYDVETLWQIYCRSVYDVRPGDRVIVDAGANIGLFAAYAAAAAPEAAIHSVEPFPETFDRLVETVRQNHLEHRTTCYNVALSTAAGLATMTANVPASQMCRLVDRAAATGAVGVDVPTMTLASLTDSIGAAVIDFLKMDIEGCEYDVLLSTPLSVLKRIRRINVEYHASRHTAADKRALAQHVCDAGFSLREHPSSAEEYGMFHFSR
jgi:FkbM family methyltransferase